MGAAGENFEKTGVLGVKNVRFSANVALFWEEPPNHQLDPPYLVAGFRAIGGGSS